MKYPKRSQYKHAKSPYRVRNWPEYEAGLRRRGDVWLSDASLDAWHAPANGKPGGQRRSSLVFGFAGSPRIDRSICSSTARGLGIHVGHLRTPPKNRAWRKLHLAVDAGTGEIVASDLTDRRTHDCTRVGPLLEPIPAPLASLSADGAYDAGGSTGRLNAIREIGRREWHKRSGYSKRSRVENTVYRYKTIIGRSMRSRTIAGQRVEVQLASKILNTMARLGMPDSYRMA